VRCGGDGGATGSRARRCRRPDAALPDADAQKIGALDDCEFDVRARRKPRVAFEGRPKTAEPLIVRQRGPRFQIIAGERRYQAAVQVGLREVPIVIRESDDNEVIEIALIENIQRKDLTPFEEAEALASLASRCNYTHEDMARRLGKSRTSVTESLSLNGIPEDVKNLCRLADINSKSLLLQVVRQGDPQKMVALVEKISRDGGTTTREAVRRETAKPKPGRPKAFTFSYKAPTKAFKLQLKFAKSRVERDEVIEALEAIIKELRAAK